MPSPTSTTSHSELHSPSGLTPSQPNNSNSSWAIAAAWAYSSRWNNRRLENYFYGVWNIVFQNLISDSIATVAQANATSFTPDFSIIRAHVIPRHVTRHPTINQPSTPWNNLIVTASIVPLIAELKRPPTRRSPSVQQFHLELTSFFELAHQALRRQVVNAFAIHPERVGRIILVACVGEWWSWQIATRARYSPVADIPESDFLAGAFLPAAPPLRTQPHRKAKNDEARRRCIDSLDEHLPSSDKVPYTRSGKSGVVCKSDSSMHYTDLGDMMEQPATDTKLQQPLENMWTLPILLGSEASTQHFFVIHHFLSEECILMLGDLDNNEEPNSEEDEGVEEYEYESGGDEGEVDEEHEIEKDGDEIDSDIEGESNDE